MRERIAEKEPGSFKDPSGFVFYQDGEVYRQANEFYREDYEMLMESGLYEELVRENLLIPHEEVNKGKKMTEEAYKVLKPERLPFISYPYEWCFSQLKDAALLTLEVQKRAIKYGMSLKDGAAFNVQFKGNNPIFIDTLSFERWGGEPWKGYRQFCRQFLAPLALINYAEEDMNRLMRVYNEGIPLQEASSRLPFRTVFNMGLLAHIHLHARSQERYADKRDIAGKFILGDRSMQGVIESLERSIRKLEWEPTGTEWDAYYSETNYSLEAQQHKERIIGRLIQECGCDVVWDVGANTGRYSRVAADEADRVLSFDADPAAVEKNYRRCREREEAAVFPLLMDVTNPSPGIGWRNRERKPLFERGEPDVVLALALLHHLVFSYNVSLDEIASFFGEVGDTLIIEFVPKEDSNAQKLLASRKEVFEEYSQSRFEEVFSRYFDIQAREKVMDSKRSIYLLRKG